MKNIDQIGKYTGILTLVEIGLGSFLHSLKIPFSGMFLSLNQIFLLTISTREIRDPNSPGIISTASAVLKSLAPAGKKLTPMLAISAQGHLYGLGIRVFGQNIFGRCLGGILSSLWSFLQPLTIYLILFGKDLAFMASYYENKLTKVFTTTKINFIDILIYLVLFKVFLAIIIVIGSHFIKQSHVEKYLNWSQKLKFKPTNKQNMSPLKGTLKDMFKPLFLLSFILMGVFYFYSTRNYTKVILNLTKPLAVAFILFYLIRVFPIEKIVAKLRDGKFKLVIHSALEYIKK